MAVPAQACDGYVQVRTLEYRWAGLPIAADGIVVRFWEKTSRAAVITRTLDDAHANNFCGTHRGGFCRACADLYVTLQDEDLGDG